MKPLKGIFDSIGETISPGITDPSKIIRETVIYNSAKIGDEFEATAFGKKAMNIDSIDELIELKEKKAEMNLDSFDKDMFKID